MKAREVNFDGLVGLTHHYAGLSFGNKASTRHRHQVSNPRLAAKQGLLKMKALADAGYPQAVIPPHERPFIPALRQLGFSGSDEQVIEKVARQAPHWLLQRQLRIADVGSQRGDGGAVGGYAGWQSAPDGREPQ